MARSGLDQLREVLRSQFAARRDVLKARSALLGLEALLRDASRSPAADALAAEVERVGAGAHELTEIRLLNALRAGSVDVKADEAEAMERLLGAHGSSIPRPARAARARRRLDQQRAADARGAGPLAATGGEPASSREVADAARELVRTCSGIYVELQPG